MVSSHGALGLPTHLLRARCDCAVARLGTFAAFARFAFNFQPRPRVPLSDVHRNAVDRCRGDCLESLRSRAQLGRPRSEACTRMGAVAFWSSWCDAYWLGSLVQSSSSEPLEEPCGRPHQSGGGKDLSAHKSRSG